MEKIVKVLAQGQLREVEFQSQQNEKRVLKIIEVKLSDGTDTFIGEVTDFKAEEIARTPLRTDAFYAMQARMNVRSWTSKADNQTREATTIRISSLVLL